MIRNGQTRLWLATKDAPVRGLLRLGARFPLRKVLADRSKILLRLSLNMVNAIYLVKWMYGADRGPHRKNGYFAILRPEVSGLRLPF